MGSRCRSATWAIRACVLVLFVSVTACESSEECAECVAPGAPTELRAEWISGQLSIFWSRVDGAAGYVVAIDELDVVFVAAPQTLAVLDDVPAGATSVQVRGVSANGATGPSASAEVSVPSQNVVSWAADAVLEVVELGSDSVTVSWSEATGPVAEYRVLRDLVAVGTAPAEGRVFTVEGLSANHPALVSVVAVGADGGAVFGGPRLMVSVDDSTPPAWSDAQAWIADTAGQAVTLAWTPATDDVGVARYVVLDADSPGEPLATSAGPNTHTVVLGLAAGTVVNFRVEAEDAAGNRSQGGPTAFSLVPDVLAPSFPDGATLELAALTAEGATLAWTEAVDDVGVVGYRLYQDQVPIADTVQPSVLIPELDPGVRHRFTVEALDAAGNRSVDGPVLDAVLEDADAPTWALDANVLVVAVAPHSVSIVWPSAQDVVGVEQYEVYLDGQLVWGTTQLSATVDGLNPVTTYLVEVVAIDGAGNMSEALAVPVTTPLEPPPSWSDDAEVVVSDVGETHAMVQWSPHPSADTYRVRSGSLVLAEVNAPMTAVAVDTLAPATNYTVWIQVVDVNGGASLDGPAVQFETTDETAPSWPVGAAFVIDQIEPTSVKLFWPKATDNVAVDDYLVLVNGSQTTITDVTVATLEGLPDGATVQVAVQARDAAGNTSVDGPDELIVLPASVPDTQTVFQGLAVVCGGCHSDNGVTGFFASLNAFETLLMVPPYVVAGEPLQSELMALLSGLGSGAYAQMPPSGPTYLSQDQSGAAPISMDKLGAWISGLAP